MKKTNQDTQGAAQNTSGEPAAAKLIGLDALAPQLDLATLMHTQPEPPDLVIPGMEAGTVGVLHGAGAVGKSFLALQAAWQVAVGSEQDLGCGMHLPYREVLSEGEDGQTRTLQEPLPGGTVLYLSLEDTDKHIHRRLYSIRQSAPRELHDAMDAAIDEGRFRAWGLAGRGETQFFMPHPKQPGLVVTTDTWKLVHKTAAEYAPRLIIIDTLLRCHALDESSNADMAGLLRHLECLARVSGAAILLLHHENKVGRGDSDAEGGAMRGATSILDNSRYGARVRLMTKDEARERAFPDVDGDDVVRRQWMRLDAHKASYSPQLPSRWLRRTEAGCFVEDEPPENTTEAVRRAAKPGRGGGKRRADNVIRYNA